MGLTLDSGKGRALGNYRIYDLTNKENIVHDEIVFKASFIILSDAITTDKILGNFDLVVLGDIEAKSVEVKGKLICFGTINVGKVVAKEIVATNISATEVDATDGIMAQEIEADTIKSDGTILVGKNVTVEEIIETHGDILCGEGLYAYGKVKAKTIIAADNIDINEVEVQKVPLTKIFETKGKVDGFEGDYNDWKAKKIRELEQLISAKNLSGFEQYLKQNYDLEFIDNYVASIDLINELKATPQKKRVNDLVWFLVLHKVICETPSIKQFEIIADNYRFYREAFINAVRDNSFETSAKCEIVSYSDFIELITTIQQHGNKLDAWLLSPIIDKVYNSGLGVKAAYLNAIFSKRGWKIND